MKPDSQSRRTAIERVALPQSFGAKGEDFGEWIETPKVAGVHFSFITYSIRYFYHVYFVYES